MTDINRENDLKITKLLLAIADGTDARASRHDVIFRAAAESISRLTSEAETLSSDEQACMAMLEDVPGDDLTYRVEKLVSWYTDAQATISRLTEEREGLRTALDNLVTKTENVRAWLQNWDLPFADDDEWCETAKELRDALVLANRATYALPDAEQAPGGER